LFLFLFLFYLRLSAQICGQSREMAGDGGMVAGFGGIKACIRNAN